MKSPNFQNDYNSILLNNIDTTTERLPSNIISNIFINNPSKKDITYIQNINSIYTDSPKIIKNSNIYMNSPNIINASNLYPSQNKKNQIPKNKSQNPQKGNYRFLPRKKNNSQIFNTNNNIITLYNEPNNIINSTNSKNEINNIQNQMSEYFKTKDKNFYKKNNFSSENYVIKNDNTWKNIENSFSNINNQRIQSPLFFNKKNINTSSNKIDKNSNTRMSQRNWRKITKKDNKINNASKIKFSNEKNIPVNYTHIKKQTLINNKRIFSPLNDINDYSSITPLNKEKLINKKLSSIGNDKKNLVKSLTTNNLNHNTSAINNKKNSSLNKINKKNLNIKTKITPRIELEQKDLHTTKNFSSNNENCNPKVKKIVENIFQWKNLIENQKSKTSGYFHPMPENINKLKKNYSQKDNLCINQDNNSLYQPASPKELITETENNINDNDNTDNNHKKYKNINNIISQDQDKKLNNIPFPITNKNSYINNNENLAYYTNNEKILNNNINNDFSKNNDELCNILNLEQDNQEEMYGYNSDNQNQNLNMDNILEIREKLKTYYDNKSKSNMSKTSNNFKPIVKVNNNLNLNQNQKPIKAKEKIEDTLLKNNLLSHLLNENDNNNNNEENNEVNNEIITTNINNIDVNSNNNSTPSFIKTDQKILNTNNNYYYVNNNCSKINYNFRKDIISNNYNFNKNKEIKSSGLNFDNKNKNIQNYLWSTTETNQVKTKINNEINIINDNNKIRENITFNVIGFNDNVIKNINSNDDKRKQDLMELLNFSSNLGK